MDLNADLGEGGKEDAQLMNYITSCSIACGGHYGTQETIVSTLLEAQKIMLPWGHIHLSPIPNILVEDL